jgi:hypothetical protein
MDPNEEGGDMASERMIQRLDRAYMRELRSDNPDWTRVGALRRLWVRAVIGLRRSK